MSDAPLFDRKTPMSAKFGAWLASEHGATMVSECQRAIRKLRARGFTRYGIGALWEAARFSAALRLGPDAEGFKLNNNYRSRMARHLIQLDPTLEGFFQLRELKTS